MEGLVFPSVYIMADRVRFKGTLAHWREGSAFTAAQSQGSEIICAIIFLTVHGVSILVLSNGLKHP